MSQQQQFHDQVMAEKEMLEDLEKHCPFGIEFAEWVAANEETKLEEETQNG